MGKKRAGTATHQSSSSRPVTQGAPVGTRSGGDATTQQRSGMPSRLPLPTALPSREGVHSAGSTDSSIRQMQDIKAVTRQIYSPRPPSLPHSAGGRVTTAADSSRRQPPLVPTEEEHTGRPHGTSKPPTAPARREITSKGSEGRSVSSWLKTQPGDSGRGSTGRSHSRSPPHTANKGAHLHEGGVGEGALEGFSPEAAFESLPALTPNNAAFPSPSSTLGTTGIETTSRRHEGTTSEPWRDDERDQRDLPTEERTVEELVRRQALSHWTEDANEAIVRALGSQYKPRVADPSPGVTAAPAEESSSRGLSTFEQEEAEFNATARSVDLFASKMGSLVDDSLQRTRAKFCAADGHNIKSEDPLGLAKSGVFDFVGSKRTPHKRQITPSHDIPAHFVRPHVPVVVPHHGKEGAHTGALLPSSARVTKPSAWKKYSEERFLYSVEHETTQSLSARMCAGVPGQGVHKEIRHILEHRKQEKLDELHLLGPELFLQHQDPSFWEQLQQQSKGSGAVSSHVRKKYVDRPPVAKALPKQYSGDGVVVRQRKLELERETLDRKMAQWEAKMHANTSTGASAQFCAKTWLTWIRVSQMSRMFASAIAQQWDPFDEAIREKALFHPPHGGPLRKKMVSAGFILKNALFRNLLRMRIRRKRAAIGLLIQWLRVLNREMKLKFAVHHYLSRVRRIQRNWRLWAASRRVRSEFWARQYVAEEHKLIRILTLEREIAALSEVEGTLAGGGSTSPSRSATVILSTSTAPGHTGVPREKEQALKALKLEHLAVNDLMPEVRGLDRVLPTPFPVVMMETNRLFDEHLDQCRTDFRRFLGWVKLKRDQDLARERWRKENEVFLTRIETGNPDVDAAYVNAARLEAPLPIPPQRPHVSRNLKRRVLVELFLKLQQRGRRSFSSPTSDNEATSSANALSAAVRSEAEQALKRKKSIRKVALHRKGSIAGPRMMRSSSIAFSRKGSFATSLLSKKDQ